MVKRSIALLGATGSIGSSTLSVITEQSGHFRLSLISAHTDHASLTRIARQFECPILCLTGISDSSRQAQLRAEHPDLKIYFGEDELLRLLQNEDYDLGLNAITGSAGLRSSEAILLRGKDLALANKESLVMAGHILTPLAKQQGKRILPVDSEHSAIFQALGKHPASEIRKLIITASGGAFRDLPLSEFGAITPEAALRHPNWTMGAKVTLDSATMFNKALEVIEAHWLFDLPYEQITALMHPQSVIHSLVEFIDGSLLAQLSAPDMRLPILYALSYPRRYQSDLVETALTDLPSLSFRELEPQRYPLFFLGLEVAKAGGLLPTVMNAANEAALKLFLERRISFKQICTVIRTAVESFPNENNPGLQKIIHSNQRVFQQVIQSTI